MALKVLTWAQNWAKAAMCSRDIEPLRYNQCLYPPNNNFTRQQHRPSYRTKCDFASLIYRTVQISLRSMATQFTQLTQQSILIKNHAQVQSPCKWRDTKLKRPQTVPTPRLKSGAGPAVVSPTPRNTPLTANGKRHFFTTWPSFSFTCRLLLITSTKTSIFSRQF